MLERLYNARLAGRIRFHGCPVVVCVSVLIFLLIMAPVADAIVINEFAVPTLFSLPIRITSGPDGRVWFTEVGGNNIGAIAPTGGITEFPALGSGSGPIGIVAGPDGNLWFAEPPSDIGRITPLTGIVTDFPVLSFGSVPTGITAGPDGNLWFTEQGGKIGKITTAGAVTEFPVPQTTSLPYGITAGPDGNLWFTELGGNKIGMITPAGIVSEFSIPTEGAVPKGITAGPDGNLWFTESEGNSIGVITRAGVIAEFSIPTLNSAPTGITAGPDGNLWFTEQNANKIGMITPTGVIAEFLTPTPGSAPTGITAGPDGNLWFTEYGRSQIGQVVLNTVTVPAPTGQPAVVLQPAVVTPIISSSLTLAATASVSSAVVAESLPTVLNQARPIGIGSVAVGGSLLNIVIGLNQFSAPVDLYFAMYVPAIDPGNIYILTPTGFQTMAQAGLVPWISKTVGRIYVPPVSAFQNLSISGIPSGTYTIFLAVAPAGDVSTYYLWQTSFTR